MSWYREPLLHFLVLGAALFVLHALVVENSTESDLRIVLDAAQLEHLASEFENEMGRAPNHQELDGLIEAFLYEEVLYREALALGLDQGDAIVRRQLAEKMKFISTELTALSEPTDDELATYLTTNEDRYRSPARVSLDLIHFSIAQRGEKVKDDALNALARLAAEPETEGLGDPSDFQSRYTRLSDNDATHLFGRPLSDRIFHLDEDQWHGPFEFSGGFRLVRISNRTASSLPELKVLRRKLRRDLLARRTQEAETALFARLSHGYDIRIERPPARESQTDSDSSGD